MRPGEVPLPSLSAVLNTVGDMQDGRDVDLGLVRAALAAEIAQYRALASEIDVSGRDLVAGARSALHLAGLLERLGAVVDRLEAGDVDGAKRVVVTVLGGRQ
jgi:hypothetical protein